MDRFCFYHNSANKYPGAGPNEYVTDPQKYSVLSTFPHWRRVFSSLYEHPFVFDGLTFSTVDHAMQYAKFKINGYDAIASIFSLELRNNISGLQASKLGKLIHLLTEPELARWKEQRGAIKINILMCKFAVPELKNVLLATQDAELWSAGPRLKTLRATSIEHVRSVYQGKIVN